MVKVSISLLMGSFILIMGFVSLFLVLFLFFRIPWISFIRAHRGEILSSGFYFVFKSQSECKVINGSFSVLLDIDLFSVPTVYCLARIIEISLMENIDVLEF